MLQKIFNQLKKEGYAIYGPKEQDGELHILELDEAPEEKNLNRVSDRPYKYFFTPIREALYKYEKGKPQAPRVKEKKRALFGMGLFDCKALELYDRVFEYPHPSSPLERGRREEGDFYYNERRKNIFVVGFSPTPLEKLKMIFFETNLESAVFDVFIEGAKLYARGERAEKILKSAGLKYKVILYKKHEPDKKVLAIKKAMEAGKNSKMWDELGKICLACGKCTIACPTCYCFDFESSLGLETKTERCSGNCFYDDFTRLAGPPLEPPKNHSVLWHPQSRRASGHKFLNNPKEKIFFWYYHKFVRLPKDYGLPGCVDCGRCTAVCPAGININKNIERLLKEAKDIKN